MNIVSFKKSNLIPPTFGEGESIQIVSRSQEAEYDFTKVHEIFHCCDVFGFKNQRITLSQRYLDLIMNKGVREKFIIRTKIINYILKFLNNLGFLEVETPMMTFIVSGATAKSFVTHLANFKQFTSCDFYMTYNDMYDSMITENLLSDMVKEIIDKPIIKNQCNNKHEKYNNREKILDIKFPLSHEWSTEAINKFLENIFIKHNVICNPPRTNSSLLKSEIINAYTELDDPFEQRERFNEQLKIKKFKEAKDDKEIQLIDEKCIDRLPIWIKRTTQDSFPELRIVAQEYITK
ncbi:10605_t:CDS:2 [Diversispora eburnea]|uniref:10605_t:CDS:1 n=1 Tax=Diversispora eburnea TaxID=1213867 RepID=A0A9N9F103_9GLOM|nr:10605_t:CDS:2 [Diversispora eburnea]